VFQYPLKITEVREGGKTFLDGVGTCDFGKQGVGCGQQGVPLHPGTQVGSHGVGKDIAKKRHARLFLFAGIRWRPDAVRPRRDVCKANGKGIAPGLVCVHFGKFSQVRVLREGVDFVGQRESEREAIEERAREGRPSLCPVAREAATPLAPAQEMSAAARVRGRKKLKVGGKRKAALGARQVKALAFEGFSERFKFRAGKLKKLVEKKSASVS
jgi:hypothetical protein